MGRRSFEPGLLAEPATLRARFTDKGRVRRQYGGGWSFQVSRVASGAICIWTVGPLGGWHDFQTVPEGTSFDDALGRTYLPAFLGWT